MFLTPGEKPTLIPCASLVGTMVAMRRTHADMRGISIVRDIREREVRFCKLKSNN